MKKTKVTHPLTFRNIGAFFALSTMPALAQSGHTINSVDTRPGTTAPMNPTDNSNLGQSPTAVHADDQMLIKGSELTRDAGSADRKSSRVHEKKLNGMKRGSDLPNTRDSAPSLPSNPPTLK